MRESVRVQRVEDEAALAEALEIRRVVFVVEQAVPLEEDLDAHDRLGSEAVLVLARLGERAVGTGRLLGSKVQRMAVLGEARGAGVGAAILETLARIALERGLEELVLEAQVHAIPFYERAGYVAEGEEFLDVGIPHRRMRRRL